MMARERQIVKRKKKTEMAEREREGGIRNGNERNGKRR